MKKSRKRKAAKELVMEVSEDSENEDVLVRVGEIPYKKWY
jgi:hypothetical protein